MIIEFVKENNINKRLNAKVETMSARFYEFNFLIFTFSKLLKRTIF